MRSPTMKSSTSKQLTPLLLALIALIPSHRVRYTALGLLLAAATLCKIHLQSPSVQLSRLEVALNRTEEYIQEATVEAPQIYSKHSDRRRRLLEVAKTASRIKCRILRSQTKALSWKGLRSLSKDIAERMTRFRALCNEIGECIHCVKDIRTAVELILEAELDIRNYMNSDGVQYYPVLVSKCNLVLD
ncbi:hypothetical protein DFH08DRAFT_1023739 [Mycena albidolilacea]|uniref:Uncharacterized protein n=1 Tax=Mycena albidolilacea TaxID=1033008 RepID=A0AAD7EK48_9AGAR|nr:hypothetical protein DFH08DRAFT_1023739 [Mycena albidolilacea]